jgi:hypothetical protein
MSSRSSVSCNTSARKSSSLPTGEVKNASGNRALAWIQLDSEATYLNFAENDFYVALLRRDVSFFETVADLLHSQIATAEPHQIFCDAIEFYNPVHDITLPLVLRAADSAPQAMLFEVPLVIRRPQPVSTTRFSESRPHPRNVVFVIIWLRKSCARRSVRVTKFI